MKTRAKWKMVSPELQRLISSFDSNAGSDIHPVQQKDYVITYDIKKYKKRWLDEDDAASVIALHSVREAPILSLRRREIETEISKSHFQRIFMQNRILPFKPKFRHTLEEGDEVKRLDFCLEMGNRVLND
ncbi:hypothetical protein NQ318_010519 [Aromia moschata]|uniref:Uncharacterized protein n=1 Tax=Aromia moschata TaxID=1265417 RepID=A0AAV8YFR0_9CUCU|nr:hypothetical protein NQ318_010519 [Aromia moschata]